MSATSIAGMIMDVIQTGAIVYLLIWVGQLSRRVGR
jgi:hypothetical protein